MSYANILITGANRGIGLELVKQYAAKASTKLIFATCRDESKAADLRNLAAADNRVKIIELEVRDYSKYEKIVEQVTKDVGPSGLNLLINNAGILIKTDLHEVTRDNMMEVFEVNAIAPLLFTRALIPLLQTSSKSGHKTCVAMISSKVGSIADNKVGQLYSYRTSKAALNMISKGLAVQLQPENIIVTSIHPGHVRTDMGGPNGKIDTLTSANAMIKTIAGITPDQAGILLNYDGEVIPF